MSNPFSKDYRPQIERLDPTPASTAESRLKQSLRREQRGGVAFDRNPIRLSSTDADMAKAALIRTPSVYRPREGS